MAEKQISLGDLNSGQLQEVKRQLEEVRIRFYSILQRGGLPILRLEHRLVSFLVQSLLNLTGNRALVDVFRFASIGAGQVPIMRKRCPGDEA